MQNAENLIRSGNYTNLMTHQIFKDESTHEKIHRHLSDINDQITDQDISNIKTEMSAATQIEFERSARRAGFSKREIANAY